MYNFTKISEYLKFSRNLNVLINLKMFKNLKISTNLNFFKNLNFFYNFKISENLKISIKLIISKNLKIGLLQKNKNLDTFQQNTFQEECTISTRIWRSSLSFAIQSCALLLIISLLKVQKSLTGKNIFFLEISRSPLQLPKKDWWLP